MNVLSGDNGCGSVQGDSSRIDLGRGPVIELRKKGVFTMMPKDDWRRRRQEDYLTGVRLYHVPFTPLCFHIVFHKFNTA